MSISKKVNVFRRFLMRALTKNIGNPNAIKNVSSINKAEIKRVLICRPNHRLGNLLLITPLIQEIFTTFPECKIDFFVKGGLSPILFKNHENTNKIIQLPKKPFSNLIKYVSVWVSLKKQHYDLAVNVDKNSSSGKLSTQLSNSKFKVFGDANEEIQLKYKDHEHIAKYPIYNLRYYLSQFGFENTNVNIPLVDLKLTDIEILEGNKVLKTIVDNEKSTICIFTFATGDKCYSESWWEEFYAKLITKYEINYNIIEILPFENVSQIAFKAPTFYSKDVREIAAVIANTKIFIGADSGIMHLASASLTTTIGLFSSTNQNIYEPYGNNSMAINTNIGNTTEWIEKIDKKLSTFIRF